MAHAAVLDYRETKLDDALAGPIVACCIACKVSDRALELDVRLP